MTHGVTIEGHTAHAGGSTHLQIPAATHSGRDIHADLERVHGRVCPIVLRDPTPDAIAPETKRAQADVKRYTAPAPRQRRRDRPVPQPTVDVDVVIRRYQDGDTAPAIAADMGVSAVTIRRHLVRSGVPLRDDRARNRFPARKVAS